MRVVVDHREAPANSRLPGGVAGTSAQHRHDFRLHAMMLALPEELVIRILKHLELKYLLRCTQVSRPNLLAAGNAH